MIDLQKFCAPADDSRDYLKAPVWIPLGASGKVVATNSYVLIVLHDCKESYQRPDAKIEGALMRYAHDCLAVADGKHLSGIWKPAHDFRPDPVVLCKFCDGTGSRWETKCEDCDGEGEFWHGSYEYECKNCDGDGHIFSKKEDIGAERVDCTMCDGVGHKMVLASVGLARIQAQYLVLLQELPGCQICEGQHAINNGTVFRFDGGAGLVMHCRD